MNFSRLFNLAISMKLCKHLSNNMNLSISKYLFLIYARLFAQLWFWNIEACGDILVNLWITVLVICVPFKGVSVKGQGRWRYWLILVCFLVKGHDHLCLPLYDPPHSHIASVLFQISQINIFYPICICARLFILCQLNNRKASSFLCGNNWLCPLDVQQGIPLPRSAFLLQWEVSVP